MMLHLGSRSVVDYFVGLPSRSSLNLPVPHFQCLFPDERDGETARTLKERGGGARTSAASGGGAATSKAGGSGAFGTKSQPSGTPMVALANYDYTA